MKYKPAPRSTPIPTRLAVPPAAITDADTIVQLRFSDVNMELEAGHQTRVLRFGATPPPTESSWQGHSVAEWHYTINPPRSGELKVTTTRLRPGYLRKNGVPYGASTTMTE